MTAMMTDNIATIKRLWGVVNHSPQQVLDFIESISINSFGGKLKATLVMPHDIKTSNWDKKAQIMVVVSSVALDLLATKKMDLSSKTIILVENVVIATQYKDMVLLDAKQIKSYQFKFLPLNSELVLKIRGDKNSSVVALTRSAKVDILPNLLNAQPPSVLNPVMTFAYTIPDTDKRTGYLVDIFIAIRTGGNVQSLSWFNPNNKRMEALAHWMDSPTGVKACQALANALNKVKASDTSDDYYALAEQHDVAKFDINYAVEFIKKVRVNYPNIDTNEIFLTNEHARL